MDNYNDFPWLGGFVAKVLIDNGADIKAKDEYGHTALHMAASEGRIELAKVLIGNGADINVKDQNGHTALYEATRSGHTEIVNLLKAAGAQE